MNRPLLALLLVASFALTNQTFAQVRLGVKIGVNASNIHTDAATFDPLLGYQAGLMTDIGLSSHFSIRPALLVNSKGFSGDLDIRDQNGANQGIAHYTFQPIYGEVPVLFTYEGKMGKALHWFGGIGPYAAVGIIGKAITDSKLFKDQKIIFRSRNSHTENAYHRMDYGVSTALGLPLNCFLLEANCSYGLTPI